MELTGATSPDNETFGLNFDEMQFAIDRLLVKNDPRRIGFVCWMANNHKNKEEYDKAIRCLRDALLIPCNGNEHVMVYNKLADVYEKQNKWSAALECYENIISMLQLSESAPELARAHTDAGNMYEEMQDYHNAIVNYKRGVQLYCQNKSPHHHIVSLYKITIGLIFEKLGDMDAAIKTFQEVIDLGHSGKTKVAYQQIAMIYFLKDDYEMAYYNFIQSLEIAQRENPPDIDFIINIHLHIFRTEFIRKHYDEGGIHLNEAIVMSKNYKCTEKTQKKIQSALKLLSDLQRIAQSHNRK
jgi:tetratricopeptide (TPR) repeat protein